MPFPEAVGWCWCWGKASKVEICRRVRAVEGHSMAALEVEVGVAALVVVVVALKGDDEELVAVGGSGGV